MVTKTCWSIAPTAELGATTKPIATHPTTVITVLTLNMARMPRLPRIDCGTTEFDTARYVGIWCELVPSGVGYAPYLLRRRVHGDARHLEAVDGGEDRDRRLKRCGTRC
ncbi:MAG: hypothetical protein NVS3B26_22930 [Mycobacteriales bacterium]